jgi:dTMP kinase
MNHEAAIQGALITFEGGEGAGKTTQITIVSQALRASGREVVRLREPGGTRMGEKVRELVLDPEMAPVDERCELFLYEAARAQLVAEVIAPALGRGAYVLCDRFYDSTVAYQSFGRGIDRRVVDAANAAACHGIVPDRTLLLEAPDTQRGLQRATDGRKADRIEQAGSDFHERVRAGFEQIAREEPGRVRIIGAVGGIRETAREVFKELVDIAPELSPYLEDQRALPALVAGIFGEAAVERGEALR